MYLPIFCNGASQVALMVKKLPTNAGGARDVGSIPGSRRAPGVGNGNPLQYACLENSMNRGAWRATVHRITQSWTQLKRLSKHAKVVIVITMVRIAMVFAAVVDDDNSCHY